MSLGDNVSIHRLAAFVIQDVHPLKFMRRLRNPNKNRPNFPFSCLQVAKQGLFLFLTNT
jgi:hypothetical protein